MILGHFGKIPYAGEQGDFLAYQGIQVPCSAECRDISRLDAPLVRPRAHAESRRSGARDPMRKTIGA
jgi:hypothetical protein